MTMHIPKIMTLNKKKKKKEGLRACHEASIYNQFLPVSPALNISSILNFPNNFYSGNVKQKKVKTKEKKTYTPFPPPRQPSKVRMILM